MDFRDAYTLYGQDIKRRAWKVRLPGLDYDDIVSEMLGSLWRACKTYTTEKGAFEPYWWSIWLNRRSDILLWHSRRPDTLSAGDDIVYLDDPQHDRHFIIPPPPTTFGNVEQMVWKMIALGVPREVILTRFGLTRWGYYSLIRAWKTDDVRGALID